MCSTEANSVLNHLILLSPVLLYLNLQSLSSNITGETGGGVRSQIQKLNLNNMKNSHQNHKNFMHQVYEVLGCGSLCMM